jgi:hypothetical protein
VLCRHPAPGRMVSVEIPPELRAKLGA